MALLIVAGCSDPPPQPPPPPLPPHIPAEAFVDLPKNESGEPILMAVPLGEDRLELVYDDSREDPIRFWGECLGRVMGCHATNSGSIDGCVELIELCESPSGGNGCCPMACVEAYFDARAAGRTEAQAVDTSFARGECIPGLVERAAELGMDTERAVEP